MMDKELQKEIAELSKITREKDGGEEYAKAQFNIGTKYLEQGESQKALQAWQSISHEDDCQQFAYAQFNIGVYYEEQGNSQRALEAWQKISRKDDGEIFANAQYKIGMYYQEQGDVHKSLKALQSIFPDDSAAKFVQVQFVIGLIYASQGDKQKSLQVWQNISREDDTKTFAQAQFHIGLNYDDQGDSKKAIETWQNIAREDDIKTFAQAQFYIGLNYEELGDSKTALKAWKSITREDDAKHFAKSNLNIGMYYHKQNDTQNAFETWQSISREDDSETFANAQFNIGLKYDEQGDTQKALEAWQNITREDDIKTFAKAQINIGVHYDEQGDTQKALEAWQNITREDDIKTFAKANFYIGSKYEELSDTHHALEAWQSISREDDAEQFAKAQYEIGLTYEKEGKQSEAIQAWNRITLDDGKVEFTFAQLKMGITYYEKYKIEKSWQNIAYLPLVELNKQDFLAKFNYIGMKDSAIKSLKHLESFDLIDTNLNDSVKLLRAMIYFEEKHFCQAKSAFDDVPYNSENRYYAHIYKTILSDEIGNKEGFHRLFQLVDKIRDVLFIKLNAQDTQFERKLAHYTSVPVINNLFKSDNPSDFRLNTINNVNDPTEGQLIFEYLSKNKIAGSVSVFDDDYQAFISCFTLNHDHLNQFRLYGKSEGREATGVSLVFGSEFFNASLSYHNITSNNDKTDSQSKMITQLSETLITDEKSEITIPLISEETLDNKNFHCLYQKDKKSETPKPKLSKQPVFRCVYVDPQSGFVSIAQRDEITFYRENCFNKNENDIEQSASDWQDYLDFISKKELEVKKLLEDLKNAYQNIDKADRKKHKNLIEDILLPIRYLFKHSAFHEEQECRMIHITTLYNELVQTEFERKFMYINYGENVKSHIKQVYIGLESSSYQPFIMKLLGQDKAKDVHISHSPFRNK